MQEGKWTPFNDTHPTINPKDLEKQKQHEDYELEEEATEEKKKDSSFKKSFDNLNNFFKNRKN